MTDTKIRHPLVELTLARLRNYMREPSALFWTFGFPILMTLALGTAFRSGGPQPVYAAVERSAPDAARVQATLAKVSGIKVMLLDESAAHEALRTGKVAIVVGAAKGTGARLYTYDPTRPESRIARALVDDVLQRADGRVDPTRVSDEAMSEPGSRYIDFLVPGMIGMNLMSAGMWGIGGVIVDMRTRKLIKRLVATPMRRSHFLLSFVFMRVAFLAIELPVLLGFAHFVFGVTIHASIALVAAAALAGAMAFASIGLLIAARATTNETMNGLMNLIQLPMFMCSGVFFSTSHFPDAMQPFVKLLPLTTLNDLLRALVNDGIGLAAAAPQLAVLGAWTVVTTVVALRFFRWN